MERTERIAVLDRLGNVQKDSAGIKVTDDMLIRDPDGNIITAPEQSDAIGMIKKCLGINFETVPFNPDDGDDSVPIIAFLKPSPRKVTMLQRQAVAVLAWQARNYYPAISRDMTHVKDLLIPSAFNEVDTTPHPHHVIHREFYTEEDAFRLAEVAERIFEAQVNVFEDDDKWYVAVNSDCPELGNMED
ncbi:MAG: hypothetical protein LUG50_12245, partial [Planctomycetaceae bacterium]|nr:hypothetical protein [Planctomycetaceae bacterium]